jgi:hypothetical protein
VGKPCWAGKKEKGEKRSISIKELEGLAGGPAFYIYSIYVYIYITKLFAIESRRNRGSRFAQRYINIYIGRSRMVAAAAAASFYFILFLFDLFFYSGLHSNR